MPLWLTVSGVRESDETSKRDSKIDKTGQGLSRNWTLVATWPFHSSYEHVLQGENQDSSHTIHHWWETCTISGYSPKARAFVGQTMLGRLF